MPDERRDTGDDCRHCRCAEHDALTALAERQNAWVIANRLLTEAAKSWPVNGDSEGGGGQYEVDASDVLIAANWLYYGPGDGIST